MFMKTTALTLILVLTLLLMLLLVAFNPCIKAATETPQIQWSKTYSPNLGLSIAQTSDNGFIIAGLYKSGFHDSLSYSTAIIKTDALGNIEWEKQVGDNLTGILFPVIHISISQTSDSGYILSFPSPLNGYNDELMKLNSQGNVEWSTRVSSGKAIEVNDGYVISGFSVDTLGNTFSNITKVDSSGNILWVRNFDEDFFTHSGVQGDVAFHAISKATDGKFAIAGNWGFSFWFSIMDTDGNLLVNKTYPQDGYFNGFSGISTTSDGGYILCGGQNGYANVLYKVDGQGSLEWNNTYLTQGLFNSVIQTASNEYLVGTNFGFIVWANSSGYQKGVANYSSSTYDIVNTIDRGFAATGSLNDRLWLAEFTLESNSSPSPPVPEFSIIMLLPLLLVTFSVAILVRHRKSKKTLEKNANTNRACSLSLSLHKSIGNIL